MQIQFFCEFQVVHFDRENFTESNRVKGGNLVEHVNRDSIKCLQKVIIRMFRFIISTNCFLKEDSCPIQSCLSHQFCSFCFLCHVCFSPWICKVLLVAKLVPPFVFCLLSVSVDSVLTYWRRKNGNVVLFFLCFQTWVEVLFYIKINDFQPINLRSF